MDLALASGARQLPRAGRSSSVAPSLPYLPHGKEGSSPTRAKQVYESILGRGLGRVGILSLVLERAVRRTRRRVFRAARCPIP